VSTVLGKTIRILRQARGLTVTDAAAKAGVSVPFLSLVEKGTREPSLGVLRAIATAIGIPSEALLLTALGPQSGLVAREHGSSAIADAVQTLVEVEDKLKTLLERTEAPRATKRSKSRKDRRRDEA
jgi:transcriptional regulator with XRE-family HTH domain